MGNLAQPRGWKSVALLGVISAFGIVAGLFKIRSAIEPEEEIIHTGEQNCPRCQKPLRFSIKKIIKRRRTA